MNRLELFGLTCEYDNVPHSCAGEVTWRVWSDVGMVWRYACPAAIDALTGTPGASQRVARASLTMEEVGQWLRG